MATRRNPLDNCRAVLTTELGNIRSHFADADKEGRHEVYLPELRGDVRSAIEHLPELDSDLTVNMERLYAKLRERASASVHDVLTDAGGRPILNEEAVEKMIGRIHDLLRDRLKAFLALEEKGIPQMAWAVTASLYADFANLLFLDDISEFITYVKPWSFLDQILGNLLGVRSERANKVKSALVRAKVKGWETIVVTREMDAATINAWMGRGFIPFKVQSGPGIVFSQDLSARIESMGRRATGLDLPPEDYFHAYRARLVEEVADHELREAIEARWFFIYYETRWDSYGPNAIKEAVQKGDYDDFIQAMKARRFYFPTDAMIHAADRWLLGFAEDIRRNHKVSRYLHTHKGDLDSN